MFVILLSAFIVFSIYQSRRKENTAGTNVVPPKYSLLKSLLIILGSAVGLYFGAEWLIKGASEIAKSFDISEYLISVSVVAFGTSVPELATSVVAAFKKETDISIGNIIGSNMFNIMGILGITALVKPLRLNEQIRSFDMYWLIGLCALLFLMMLPVKSGKISRIKGVVLLISYIVYLAIIYSGDAIVN